MSAANTQEGPELVKALGETFEMPLAQSDALRQVLAHAPLPEGAGAFIEVADAALVRMGTACEVAVQLAGGMPWAGPAGAGAFVAHWCAPEPLKPHLLPLSEGATR